VFHIWLLTDLVEYLFIFAVNMPRNKVGCGTKYFVFSFNVFFWVSLIFACTSFFYLYYNSFFKVF